MPELSLKEAIRGLQELADSVPTAEIEITIEEKQIILFAISKLQLFEQVEKGGVEKLKLRDTSASYVTDLGEMRDNAERDGYITGFNSAIDLCNAHWAKKLEGIEDVIFNAIRYTCVTNKCEKTCPGYDKNKTCGVWTEAKKASQALITHLTGGNGIR